MVLKKNHGNTTEIGKLPIFLMVNAHYLIVITLITKKENNTIYMIIKYMVYMKYSIKTVPLKV